uniref:SH3 domain-containing protein n=1 Tax=Oncorhynchus kisutch TaxID=8019 RepID=A0A8C7MMK1_ONCKI
MYKWLKDTRENFSLSPHPLFLSSPLSPYLSSNSLPKSLLHLLSHTSISSRQYLSLSPSLRPSLSLPHSAPVSSSYGDHVQHFKVLQDRSGQSGQYFVWEEMFFSLNQMVEFYHSNSIAKEETVFYGDPEHPHPHHAHALFDFTPHHPSQLRFLRGDFIDLLDCSDSLRWRGRCHGRVGFFPPEYVQAVYQ